MPYVFGPVPSRRLGLSLGVDLIPPKTCTYDCLYCQVGRTNHRILEPRSFAPVSEVIKELEKKLEKASPDAITLAGSGEPTLNAEIGQVIGSIKDMHRGRIALLTNGSLFWRKEVRARVMGADVILPTLTSAFEETFKRIHRPHPGLSLPMVIEGLKSLRREYHGAIFLEVVVLSGINDTDKELEALKEAIGTISPEKVQINTVARPPSDRRAKSVDSRRLNEIRNFLGEKAEIVAETHITQKSSKQHAVVNVFLDMVKRRPLRAVDAATALSLPLEEIEDLLKGLLLKGYILREEHLGEIFYLSAEKNVEKENRFS